MKWHRLFFISIFFTITACSTPATPAGTQTPQPTITPASIIIANFTAQMEGVGEHGNMACIYYQGNKLDLEGLKIKAEISQNNKKKESDLSIQQIDGKDCFEMLDIYYSPGSMIDITLNISAAKSLSKEISQNISLGKFGWSPFIYPFFSKNDFPGGNRSLGVIQTHGWENGLENEFYAMDFCMGKSCQGSKNKLGEGTPVYMPFSFQVVAVQYTHLYAEYPATYNIWLYHPYTGFIFELNHQMPGEVILDYLKSIGFNGLPTKEKQYNSYFPYRQPIIPLNQYAIVSTWGPNDHPNGNSHLHIEGQLSYPALGIKHPTLFASTGWVDGNIDQKGNDPRFQNCRLFGQSWGPCFDEGGKPIVANISIDKFMINGWLK